MVSPLLKRFVELENENQELTRKNKDLVASLKAYTAVLRCPRLTTLYFKTEKERMHESKIAEENKKAMYYLHDNKITSKNEQKFITDFI